MTTKMDLSESIDLPQDSHWLVHKCLTPAGYKNMAKMLVETLSNFDFTMYTSCFRYNVKGEMRSGHEYKLYT